MRLGVPIAVSKGGGMPTNVTFYHAGILAWERALDISDEPIPKVVTLLLTLSGDHKFAKTMKMG